MVPADAKHDGESMKSHEFLVDQLDEGWKEWAAGAAVAGGLAAGAANMTSAPPAQDPAPITQPADPMAALIARTASDTTAPTPATVARKAATTSTSQYADAKQQSLLQKTATASGIKGIELAQFLAQCAHESSSFTSMQEKGSDEYFKQYDPSVNADKARLLGNTQTGDGVRYRGRGFIHITGRDNYQKAEDALDIPLVKHPELASKPEVAAKIAVWFWKTRVRPNVSDWTDTRSVTRKINPAMQGLEDRAMNFQDYKKKLKIST